MAPNKHLLWDKLLWLANFTYSINWMQFPKRETKVQQAVIYERIIFFFFFFKASITKKQNTIPKSLTHLRYCRKVVFTGFNKTDFSVSNCWLVDEYISAQYLPGDAQALTAKLLNDPSSYKCRSTTGKWKEHIGRCCCIFLNQNIIPTFKKSIPTVSRSRVWYRT